MKKAAALIFSFIILFSFVCPCYADNYEVDSFSNNSTLNSQQVKINSSCYYDKIEGYFTYKLSSVSDNYVKCSLYNGEITTDSVKMIIGDSANVEVYLDGNKISCSGEFELTDKGFYTVRNASSDSRLMSFTIVNSVTGVISSYTVPSLFYISEFNFDGVGKSYSGSNTVSLADEGHYKLRYYSPDLGISRTLELDIDTTAPVLELTGVTDNVATGSVTIGDLEEGATLETLKDGEVIANSSTLDDRGTYHLNYTDAAGNTSTYDFTIRLHLNINSWIFIAAVAVIIAAVIGFMIYCRRHMRTF